MPEKVADLAVVTAPATITFEDYLEHYAIDFYEWVDGVLEKFPLPIHEKHDALTQYLILLIRAYFELKPIGKLRHAPFVMSLPNVPAAREPDLQVILNNNPHEYSPTLMRGPADICIEIVSPESVKRDYEQKFREYEKGGVPEYWILDYSEKKALFYVLDESQHYTLRHEDAEGNYSTARLPGFLLHVPTLWQEELPGPGAVLEAVKKVLEK